MKHMKSWVMVSLFVLCSSCATTGTEYTAYSSRAKLPSSFSNGTAMIGIGVQPAESVVAFSIRGNTLLYKPSSGGTWQTVEIESITGVQVKRATRSNRILSGAFIGSSLGLGLGIVASKVLDFNDDELTRSAATGLYPSAGAFAGLVLGISSTSIGTAPWDTYVPRKEENGWRLVKEDL